MFLYHENGIAYTEDWSWIDNGEYPIIQFDKYLFVDKFIVTDSDGNVLADGTDYRRILKSKDIYMKFNEDIFAGIVMLSTESVNLNINGLSSCDVNTNLPLSTTNPTTVMEYCDINPMAGDYNDLVGMIDELRILIPRMKGNDLPTYFNFNMGTASRSLSVTGISTNHNFPILDSVPPAVGEDNLASPRMGYQSIDSVPIDYDLSYYDTSDTTP